MELLSTMLFLVVKATSGGSHLLTGAVVNQAQGQSGCQIHQRVSKWLIHLASSGDLEAEARSTHSFQQLVVLTSIRTS